MTTVLPPRLWTSAYDGVGLIDYPEYWNSEHVQDAVQTGDPHFSIRVPVASNYDLDNDYDYIMSRALRSYKQHRETEKAETRKGPLKSAYLRRHHIRPRTAPLVRFIETVKVRNVEKNTNGHEHGGAGGLHAKMDPITEVTRANPGVEDDAEERSRPTLHVSKVSINMMQDTNRKTASYLKRNQPSHPWHSHSYPSVRPMEKFVRPPHAYMSASVNERDLSSALSSSSSRSSSAKSSPVHKASKTASAGKASSVKNNSNYYYDGGLFTHPRDSHADYFVIHPDWVSESMSIQKLSLTERKKQLPPKSKSMTWPGRRCNSAPPSKYRNPITWETIETTA
ncbi:uncharacterized protein LOC127879254 isoform X2 [Dreissena polymorpha]|uniref:Uncharacterized protein n=1 Tax=Dreissena polymorpha TaxID=45954 RepID=A0A9D4QJE8_DREPO|nr:uncharacterized protein LOC127879254 isoform X2 [Dreissena polymorpha]KAH3833773.1 hypothetical protein DPMN_107089 [Dreissena polymorpha]